MQDPVDGAYAGERQDVAGTARQRCRFFGARVRPVAHKKEERRISIGGPDRRSRMQSLEGSKAPSVGGQRRWSEDGAEN